MARDWRRAMLAVFAAMMLGGACALGAFAQQAEEEPDEAKSETKAKKKQDPAEAQRTIDAALKQVLAGKVDQAVQAVSATMAAGNLPPAIMAKALYVRGMAYRKQGRTAQAISDLTGALWLKGGLGGEEREDAIKEKAAAYADAGLADPGNSQPAPKSAGSGNNWFSGIFGGLGGDTPTPSPPPKVSPKVLSAPVEVEPPPPPTSKTPGPQTLSSSWSDTTEVQETPPKAPAPKASKTAKVTPPPVSSGKKAEGPYLVQLAAMRTQAEALALAAKAKREHGSLLGSRGQSIDRHVYGNMGAYYLVRFGPFESAQETQTVCAKLQGGGIDCLPISQ
jgi:cell division protein FtsN